MGGWHYAGQGTSAAGARRGDSLSRALRNRLRGGMLDRLRRVDPDVSRHAGVKREFIPRIEDYIPADQQSVREIAGAVARPGFRRDRW
jgi:hypothetical protein